MPSNGGIGIKLKSPSPRFTTAILMKRPLYSLRKFDLINIKNIKQSAKLVAMPATETKTSFAFVVR